MDTRSHGYIRIRLITENGFILLPTVITFQLQCKYCPATEQQSQLRADKHNNKLNHVHTY